MNNIKILWCGVIKGVIFFRLGVVFRLISVIECEVLKILNLN